MPIYAEEINMLAGLEDTELEAYLNENPWILPLFEIDVLEATSEYAPTSTPQEEEYEPDHESMKEISKAREVFKKEMEILRRVTASALEEINVGTMEVSRLLSIAKDLMPNEKMAMAKLL